MRTIFEDTNVKAEVEESRIRGNERKSTLPILWMVSLLFVGSVMGVYFWADSRPALKPPAPPVSLEDPRQTADAISKFNHAVLDGKWDEAQALLSEGAAQRLKNEQKSLAESLLGKYKDYKILAAEITQSIDRSDPRIARFDCLYKFTDDPVNYSKIEQRIISLALVIDNDRLAIDNWSGASEEPKEQRKTAVNK